MRQRLRVVLIVLMLGGLTGCGLWRGGGGKADGNSPLYFKSAAAAVEETAGLLRASDWATLRRYYDLEGSDVGEETLESGAYFVNCPPGGAGGGAESAGPCRYLHPFDPRYRFSSVNPGARAGEYEVVVQIEIEEEGGMNLKGYASFEMRRSGWGWRILPR